MGKHRLETDDLDDIIAQLCETKKEEFKLYGYEHVTGEEIWQCVSASYKGTLPPLHRLTNDILSLKVTTFMNWMTVNMYKGIGLD
mgnify:CR=1 FL=1